MGLEPLIERIGENWTLAVAVFTITSWVTLCTMWGAAAITDRLLDQRPAHRHDPASDQAMPGQAAHLPAASA